MLFVASIQLVQAQGWHAGLLILPNNEQLETNILFDASTDLIQVQTGTTIKVYSARQVLAFQYFDPHTNVVRHYESHLYARNHARKTRMFFEVVVAGEMKVLRRFKSWKQARSVTASHTDQLWYDSNNTYDYLVYTQNKFIPIKNFKKVILPQLLQEYGDALNAFMKKQQLTVFSQRGRLMVINRYNVLKNAEAVARF